MVGLDDQVRQVYEVARTLFTALSSPRFQFSYFSSIVERGKTSERQLDASTKNWTHKEATPGFAWLFIRVFCLKKREAGMGQWSEHSLPTNLARVRFPDPGSYVGWVCCWFSILLRGFSPGYPVFLPPQKPTLQIPIRSKNIGQMATTWMCHCKFLCIFNSFLFYFISLY